MNPQHTTTLSIETVQKIAKLSRLALTEDEVKIFHKELEQVLQAFQTLSEVEIPEELTKSQSALLLNSQNTSKTATEALSSFQADDVNNSLSTENFIASTPEHEGVFVKVPAVLNQEH